MKKLIIIIALIITCTSCHNRKLPWYCYVNGGDTINGNSLCLTHKPYNIVFDSLEAVSELFDRSISGIEMYHGSSVDTTVIFNLVHKPNMQDAYKVSNVITRVLGFPPQGNLYYGTDLIWITSSFNVSLCYRSKYGMWVSITETD